MALAKVKLDSAGIEEVLLGSAVGAELDAAANAIAERARSDAAVQRNGVEVNVEPYIADGGRLRGRRQARSIALAHPAGLGIEAKYGTLTRAAGGSS